MADLIYRAKTSAEMVKHAKGSTVIGGQTFRTIKLEDALDAIAALPAQGVKEDIDALAYRFWSIHPKDIPEPVGMPEGYKGGKRAWFYANEMRRILAALEPAEAGGKRAEEERDRRIEPEEVDRMLGASEPIMAEAYYGAEAAREAADARVAELEAALRFYADEETYETQYERLFCGCCTDIFEPINNDKGAIARATLAGKE